MAKSRKPTLTQKQKQNLIRAAKRLDARAHVIGFEAYSRRLKALCAKGFKLEWA